MYTPAQTAQMLQIAGSTLRKYSRLYADHLSLSAHRKQRTYTDEDISVLKQVVDLRAEGVPLEEIPGRLAVQAGPVAPENSLALIPAISAAFDDLRAQIAAQNDTIAALRLRLDELEADRHQNWLQRLLRRK